MIKVKFFATIRLVTGVSNIDIDITSPVTVFQLIEIASKILKKDLKSELLENDREIKHGTIILLNGKNILHIDKLNTLIKDNDTVSIFPPAGGG